MQLLPEPVEGATDVPFDRLKERDCGFRLSFARWLLDVGVQRGSPAAGVGSDAAYGGRMPGSRRRQRFREKLEKGEAFMDGYAEILQAYINDREPTLDVTEAIATGRPYQREHKVYVFSEDFAPWLSQWEHSHRRTPRSQEYRVAYPARTAGDIDRFLSGIGATRVSLQTAVRVQPAIRQAWRLE